MPLSQKEMLERVPIDEIAHGVQLPLDLLEKYCLHTLVRWKDGKDYDIGPGLLWNVGSGNDLQKVTKLREMGFNVIDTDINKDVVIAEQTQSLVSIISDAEGFGDRMGLMAIMLLERVPTVWMGGLLENMGTGWKKAIQSAYMALAPLGYLVIGGVARAERENSVFKTRLGESKFKEYQTKWIHRYKTANRYNSRRYQYGAFPVARPGAFKYLEWGSSSDIDRLVHSDFYERDAQHMSVSEIVELSRELGMKLVLCRDEVWNARTPGDLYSGYTLLLQKIDRYFFDPFRAGMSYAEGAEWSYKGGTDKLAQNLGLKQYWQQYRINFLRNAGRVGIYPSESMLAYLSRLVNERGIVRLSEANGGDRTLPDPNDM